MNNRSQNVINWRRRAKIRLIEYKGGKCEICGYNKPHYSAYVFHHSDPSEKDFSVSGKSWGFDRLKSEVDKCQLLCVLCHAEIHDKEYENVGQSRISMPAPRTKTNFVRQCNYCTKDYLAKREKQKYCCIGCSLAAQTRTHIPSADEITELSENLSNIEIGKIYGVSEAAVRKWKKRYKNACLKQ